MGTILSFDAARSLGRPSNVIAFPSPALPPLGTFGQLFDADGYEVCTGWVHRHEGGGRITVRSVARYEIEGDAEHFKADDAPSGDAA